MEKDYITLRNEIRAGINALLAIQPKRTVKIENDGNSVYVDGIRVPLQYGHWGYGNTVVVSFDNSRRSGTLRSKKDGGFDYMKLISQILEFVDKEKELQEARRARQKLHDDAVKFLNAAGVKEYGGGPFYASADYDGDTSFRMKFKPGELEDLGCIITVAKIMRTPDNVSVEELDKLVALLTKYKTSVAEKEAVQS